MRQNISPLKNRWKFRTRLLDRRVVTEENVTGLTHALAHIYRLYASAESSSAYGNLLVC